MGRQRNRLNKGDIIIDLTSLLDVVFIVLLILICNQKNVTNIKQAEAQAKQEEALELAEQAKAQLKLYTDQIETANSFNCTVSVYARYDPDNITQRHILILKSGESTEEVIDMVGNNTEVPLDELKENLEKYINSNAGKPIILSLNENDEAILYRDEQAIQKIFNELKNDSGDVYIK